MELDQNNLKKLFKKKEKKNHQSEIWPDRTQPLQISPDKIFIETYLFRAAISSKSLNRYLSLTLKFLSHHFFARTFEHLQVPPGRLELDGPHHISTFVDTSFQEPQLESAAIPSKSLKR
ncbi:hypothetical protein NE237_018003 [Protea cynaroides]|uniref:Uncharacterized protein n=1 Tax=Protea cynaroides TaxID=273540 RepID=A0A9Q0K924_9MAGN|nr:hypothetical protein NE237_018003 [Protea cynaroides]